VSAEPMEKRAYLAEMRAIIDAEMHDSDSAPAVAARIVTKLRATDPDLLAGWLDLGAAGWLCEAIGHIDRSARSRARAVAGRSAFAEGAAVGDVTGFLTIRYVIDDEQTRKPLAHLGRDELLYVAKSYDAAAKTSQMEAAFFRALAKQVGTGTVADHFTEQQITDMRRSIVSR